MNTSLETLVTYNPTSISTDATLDDAMRLIGQYGLRHLPVVDPQRNLIGIVSDLDVRRAVANAGNGASDGLASGPTAGDIMTRRPVTMDHDASPSDALRAMLDGHFHSVPVVESGRLIGIVTSTDFLREFSYREMAVGGEPVSRHMHDDEARIEDSASIDAAARLMDELGIEHLAVVKGACPIGVISRRALRSHVGLPSGQGDDTYAIEPTVGPIADTTAPVVRPTDRLKDAALRLSQSGVGAASVVDRANRLVGLLTEDRVLAAIANQMGAMV